MDLKRIKSKIQNAKSKIGLFLLLLLLSRALYAQTFGDGYYRLTSQWQGEGKSLDVINDGVNNKVHLAGTAHVSGQFWKITPLGNGYYRLTTQWLGESKSLEAANDGPNNKLQLAKTSSVAGQFWKITSIGNGFYRLTTQGLGDGKSLDIVNDGVNDKLQLAETGYFSGQFWKIAKASSTVVATSTPLYPTKDFKQISFSGFKVMVNPKITENADTKEALKILSEKLILISNILKPSQLEKLKKVPFWIQYKLKTDGAMWYHTSKDWLVSNGYPAELAKSIEIMSVRNFIDWQGDQPLMVLHELAHAYEDLSLSTTMQNKIVETYNNAVSSGKYINVPHIRGGKQRHYALNNKTEYFAELTEAYFGKNDYYPFNQEQLKEFDPAGYKLMQEAWK